MPASAFQVGSCAHSTDQETDTWRSQVTFPAFTEPMGQSHRSHSERFQSSEEPVSLLGWKVPCRTPDDECLFPPQGLAWPSGLGGGGAEPWEIGQSWASGVTARPSSSRLCFLASTASFSLPPPHSGSSPAPPSLSLHFFSPSPFLSLSL